MTRNDLPPIFAKVRFRLPKPDVPAVVFRFTKQHIDEARQTIASLTEEIPLYTYAHCWLETPWLGILAYCPDEKRVHVRSWNRHGKHPTNFWFSDFTESGLTDLETIAKAQYFQAGVRVWVRAHTRGDASLGRVTRVMG